MRIAILSPGPSLSKTWDPDAHAQFDLVIAVNNAAAAYQCDWWCIGDFERYQNITPLVVPDHIATLRRNEFTRDQYQHPHVVYWDEMKRNGQKEPLPARALSYSAPAALVLAFDLGAKQIDCYGCDMAGAGFFDGTTDIRHIEERWVEERKIWDALTAWLQHHSVSVIRHTPKEVAHAA